MKASPAPDTTPDLSPEGSSPEAPVAAVPRSSVRDFIALMKLRLNTMVLVATTTGYWLAHGDITGEPLRFIGLLFFTLCAAAGAAAINQGIEGDRDRLMRRTRDRPVAAGRIAVVQAILFGAGLSTVGVAGTWLSGSPTASALTAITVLLYVGAYTPLKPRTTLNTVVGAVPGAIPAVIGWAAVTDSIGIEGAVIFGILFFWQFPHFYAIATMYKEDYAAGGFVMLPVVDATGYRTAWQVLTSAMCMVPLGMMPSALGLTGNIYAIGALLAGLYYLYASVRAVRTNTVPGWRKLLFASLWVLPTYYLLMAIDRADQIPG